MLGPGDQSMAGGEGRACMRASRADRDQVIDVLKSAFVREQLTKDELNDRIGRALAARTYADLDPLTADIPAGPRPAPRVPSTLGAVGPDLVRPPVPAPASDPRSDRHGSEGGPPRVCGEVAALHVIAGLERCAARQLSSEIAERAAPGDGEPRAVRAAELHAHHRLVVVTVIPLLAGPAQTGVGHPVDQAAGQIRGSLGYRLASHRRKDAHHRRLASAPCRRHLNFTGLTTASPHQVQALMRTATGLARHSRAISDRTGATHFRRSGRLRGDDHVPTAKRIAGRSVRQRSVDDGRSLMPMSGRSHLGAFAFSGVFVLGKLISPELVTIRSRFPRSQAC